MIDRNEFYREVYHIVEAIPAGRVLTYGQIANLTGWPRYSRMTGQAMKHIPDSLNLPSHRVVNSQGRLVPSWPKQRELLEKEGVAFKENGCVDLRKHQWEIVHDLPIY